MSIKSKKYNYLNLKTQFKIYIILLNILQRFFDGC